MNAESENRHDGNPRRFRSAGNRSSVPVLLIVNVCTGPSSDRPLVIEPVLLKLKEFAGLLLLALTDTVFCGR